MKISFAADGSSTIELHNATEINQISCIPTGSMGAGTLTLVGTVNGVDVTLKALTINQEDIVTTGARNLKLVLAGSTAPTLDVEVTGPIAYTRVNS